MAITVERINGTTFTVTVEQRTLTVHTHTVIVRPDYLQKLMGGLVPAETLVEKSFQFLLEREPSASILREFDLPVIQRYFPEYEKTVRTMLA